LYCTLLLAGGVFLLGGQSSARADQPAACGTDEALSSCLSPKPEWLFPERTNRMSRYEAASVRYFLTMKSDQGSDARIATDSTLRVRDFERPLERGEWNPINKWFRSTTLHPQYSPLVVRFEWPPWLLTTGYGDAAMRATDEALRAYQTDYRTIDCRFFPEQPFGRCRVVFLYGRDNPSTTQDERTDCPIYEEFTFNDAGQITFIEAWTDHPDYLPMAGDDPWAEDDDVMRLSTRIPGLGNAQGRIAPSSRTIREAAAAFDAEFTAPFWSTTAHRVGPFKSMVEDITGRVGGTVTVPGVSIWPNWLARTLAHGNALKGCHPPALR
jgi:hypothetical protein